MKTLLQDSGFFESIYNGVDEAIFVVDVTEEGEFRFAGLNPAHEKITGMVSDEIKGKTLNELLPAIPPDAIKAIRNNYETCLQKGSIHIYEEMIPINGVETHWLTRLTPLFSEAGRIYRMVGIATDISHKAEELARLKEEQLERESRYELITKSINLGLWDWPVNQDNVFYNKIWKEQLGYSEDELENKFSTWEKLLHPNDMDRMFQEVKDYLENPEDLFVAEFRMKHKDGSYRWISNRASSLLDKQGKVLRMFGAHSDITKQKRRENKLHKTERRYRSLFENALDMIHIIDANGKIILINAIELETMEYLEYEMVGHSFIEFVDPDFVEGTSAMLKKVIEGESIKMYETVLLSKSARQIHVQVSVVPEIIKGQFHSAFAIMRDVTDLRRVNRELAHANEELIEKNREMEQIVFVTSHDLRSPLVNIQGFNQELELSIQEIGNTLDRADLPEAIADEISMVMNHDIPESIDFIKSSILKMDSLLKGLLSVSRLGRRPLEIKEIRINDMIEEIVKSFSFQIKDKGIVVEYEDLPDCAGDENQINQMFSNLIDNAIKFIGNTRKGRISITGTCKNSRIFYTVKDNGIGIPLSKQEKVFEIFHKHEPGISGEGLGLTIVRKIVEKHRGRISIESEPGKGSSFIVSLPEINSKNIYGK